MEEEEENALWVIIITVLHFLCVLFWVVDPLCRFCGFVIFNSDLSQYCFRLFVSFPFGCFINTVLGIVFLFSGCGFVFFSLLAYRFGSCVSVLGLRFSVSLFSFYRPQYKLNRYSVASKLQTTEDNFTRQRISRGDFTEIV